MSDSPKTDSTLNVGVVGGGPAGLTFALNLTMMMGKKVKITVYEKRWQQDEQGITSWKNTDRRDQVVALQDHVIEEMPEYIQKNLFKNINECVWVGSRNIPIREVEDRLLELVQPFVQNGLIELAIAPQPQGFDEANLAWIEDKFDILVGADGSSSAVARRYNIFFQTEGTEYACSAAYQIPEEACESPLSQALNCVLSASQPRYLVNSSKGRQDTSGKKGEVLDLTDYSKHAKSPFLTTIREGLEFFNIPARYVFRVRKIQVDLRHPTLFGDHPTDPKIDGEDEKSPKIPLVFLIGDAAMTVHYWTGRGMNSAMKSAIALARNIVLAYKSKEEEDADAPLVFDDFVSYQCFMASLLMREQPLRSCRIIKDSITNYLESAKNTDNNYVPNKEQLIENLKHTRDSLQKHRKWPHQPPISDEELESAPNRITSFIVALLSLAKSWSRRKTSKAEVLVKQTFPYNSKDYLPVPPSVPLQRVPTLEFSSTCSISYDFIILWIMGNESTRPNELIEEIKNSQEFKEPPKDGRSTFRQLKLVQTIEEANTWMTENFIHIRKINVRFKVISSLQMKNNQIVVDVIRAVRSKVPRTPILVFSNKQHRTEDAFRFTDVLFTDVEVDLKYFVDVQQGKQWDAGLRVTNRKQAQTDLHSTPEQQATIDTSPLEQQSTLIDPTSDGSNTEQEPDPQSVFNYDDSSSFPSQARSSSSPPLKPLILWIDELNNDPKATKKIKNKYPDVEIKFVETYKGAQKFLEQELDDIKERVKVIITRGFYVKESKSFIDVVKLLGENGLGNVPTAAYTSSRNKLIEKTPDRPEEIGIFDMTEELLDFIDEQFQCSF